MESRLLVLLLCFWGCFSLRISPEEWRKLTDDAMQENKVLLDDVLSRPCKIVVDFSGKGNMTATPPLEENKDGMILGRLCLVHQGSNKDKPTLVSFVDTLKYLQSSVIWRGFLNRAYYAMQQDQTFYLWIGKLPKERRETLKSVHDTIPIHFLKCSEPRDPMDGLHVVKVVSMLALFEMPNPPQKVFYLDSDMFVPFTSNYRAFTDIERNFDDPSVFLIGNAGRRWQDKFQLMNAGLLGAKNNEEAKRFLGLWWQIQCGTKDQLSLYLVMMAYWSSLGTNFEFDVDQLGLDNYEKNEKGHVSYMYVMEHLDQIKKNPRCSKSAREFVDDSGRFRTHKHMLVDDPLCGIVTSSVEENSFCHCHWRGGDSCKNVWVCKHIWPPPYENAPLGGDEFQFTPGWTLPHHN